VVECLRCRLVRLYPWPTPEQLRQFYPESYWYASTPAAADLWAERYRRFVLLDHILFSQRAFQAAGGKGRVLDVGCGGGLFLRLMADRGCQVLGLDSSIEAAGTAWHAQGVPVICGSLAQAPLQRESCSLITMFHVLEHLYEPAIYLDAAHRLLKSDGRLVVQVPNLSSFQFLMLGENWNGLDIPRHLIQFRLRDLELLLRECGFEVLRRKHFSLRDNPAGFASSLAPWLDPMARRVRGVLETPRMRLIKNLLYFSLILVGVPFTLIEAACRQGSTVMIEARKRP
jgi:SAM-dependent methyltransferase